MKISLTTPLIVSILVVGSLSQGCRSGSQTSNPVSTAEVANEKPTPAAQPADAAPAAEVKKPAPRWASKKYQYNPSRTLHWDLLHTKIDIKFDWSKREAPAIATLKLTPWFYPQDSLVLDAVGFDVRSVKMLAGKKKRKVKFSYDSTHLKVRLDSTFKKGQELVLEIDYTAKPETVKEKGSAAITSDKGLYFINPNGKDPEKPKQIWTQGETQASSHWFPTIDSPNERCTQEMVITVDTAYVTLSNGLLTYSTLNRDGTRTDVWEMKQPHAPYLFMMAIGKFSIIKDKWRNKEVNYYLEPKFASKAKNIFGRTPAMLEFFSKKLGVDYPWPKYHQVIVRDYVSGAMENTSASLFMDALQQDDKTADGDNWDDIVAHELFHQWFGDLVTCESWPNLPLNESFATFGEFLWEEHTKGIDGLDFYKMRKFAEYMGEAQMKQEPLIRYYVRDKEDMFDGHSYAKGGQILQMLRSIIGDDAFFASLKLYLTRNQYKAVEIHDLRLAFEEVTGQDLNWFFNQWFFAAGHPKLKVEHYAKNDIVVMTVKQEQDTLYTPVYRLPTEVQLLLENGRRIIKKIEVNKVEHEFEWKVESPVKTILFDAQASVVGTIAHSKTVEEFIAQFMAKPRLRFRLEALRQLKDEVSNPAVEAVFVNALKDNFYSVREMAVGTLMEDSVLRNKHLATFIEMAKSDQNTNVKAEVLSHLRPNRSAQEKAALELGVKDPSPRVSSHAIEAMLEVGGEQALKLALTLKDHPNPDVRLLVMQQLAEQTDEAHYDFMAKQLDAMTGQDMFYAYGIFSKYLLKCTKCQSKGIELLTAKAKSQNVITRIAVFQALGLQDEEPGVREVLLEMRKNETDGRAKDYFNNMLKD